MNNLKSNKEEKKLQIKYHKLVVFIILIVTSFPPLINNIYVTVSILAISIVSIVILLFTAKIRINNYIAWGLIVSIIIYISSTWSLNVEHTTQAFKNYIKVFIPTVYISFLINTKKDVFQALKLFVYAKIIMAVYIILYIDLSTLGNMRIGAGSLGEDWNSNGIGLNLAFAAYALFVLIQNEKNKLIRLFYYIFVSFIVILTLLTGSKKALLLIIISILIFSILSTSRNRLKKIGISIIASLFILYLVTKVPFFYDVIGERLVTLFASFTGIGDTDNSTLSRFLMIDYGIDFFKQQPVLGYGLNNFRYLYGSLTGDYVYSHNNYIELLVGLGLVGTLIYYSGYFYLLFKSLFKLNYLHVFVFVNIIIVLIMEAGLVSYYSYYIHFFMCLSFVSISIVKREQKRNSNKELNYRKRGFVKK